MFTNWLTYRSVARSLQADLVGARFAACYTQEKNELIFILEAQRGAYHLQFSAQPRFAYLIHRQEISRARKNSVGLFPEVLGKEIVDVAIHASDRLIRVALANSCSLIFVLYSARANLHLVREPIVTSSLSDKQEGPGAGSAYSVINAFKQKYELPRFEGTWDEAPPVRVQFDAALMNGDLPVEQALRIIRPYLTGTVAREICARATVQLSDPIRTIGGSGIAALEKAASNLIEEAGQSCFRIYHANMIPTHFSLVALTHLKDVEEIQYNDIHTPLSFFVRRRAWAESFERKKQTVLQQIGRALHRVTRSIENRASPEELETRAMLYERYGNLLMLHLHDYPEQPWQMTVPDIFVDPHLVISIPLDERLSILENAERYYDKARNTRAAMVHVAGRKTALRKQKEILCTLRADVTHVASMDELKPLLEAHTRLMSTLGLTAKGEKDDKPFPFRRFFVAGGFEVWVGRNSVNNDELTVRHAHPQDLWFHARGVGGSHVVLKVKTAAGVPGKEAIRAAAAIAAYYSKYRKASTVPVAYAEKKYVIKPRGVPAGTVTLQREKVVMVKPALPENQRPADGDDSIDE